jgi:hypothetical protein
VLKVVSDMLCAIFALRFASTSFSASSLRTSANLKMQAGFIVYSAIKSPLVTGITESASRQSAGYGSSLCLIMISAAEC